MVNVAAAVVVVVGNFEAVESLSMVDADHERQRVRCEFVGLNLVWRVTYLILKFDFVRQIYSLVGVKDVDGELVIEDE